MRYLIAVAALGVVTVAGAQHIGQRPVAATREVMSGLVTPASNAVFAAASTAPRDDAGWDAVRVHALMLAESGNLLLVAGRARDEGEWARAAAALREAAEAAAKAAAARDATSMSEAGDRVYETCEQCHQRYLTQGPP